MALLEPFRGVRYELEKVGSLTDVCAPPYDVIDEAERQRLLDASPYNSVRLILPEGKGGQDRFSTAAQILAEWMRQGVLVVEEEPAIYAYQMEYEHPSRGRQRTAGVIASVGLDNQYRIVAHERTMPGPLEEQMRLLESTRANLSPVYLLVVPPEAESRAVGEVALQEWPLLGKCTEPSGVVHSLYKIDDPGAVKELQARTEDAVLVIADGHHRFEVARSFWETTSEPGSDRIMAFAVDLEEAAHDLRGTHRIVISSDIDPGELKERFADAFAGSQEVAPELGSLYSLLDEDRVVLVTQADVTQGGSGVEAHASPCLWSVARQEELATPSAWLHDSVLNGVPSQTIEFEPSLEIAFCAVAEGRAVAAVLLPPPSLEALTAVARTGSLLPQKSTYFSPKPRTGAVFRIFDIG